MYDNKVSEKVIWEGAISPEDETPIIASQKQNQPQMMFCYKCNNVIPGDSKYCPCCQIKLYTKCPKCGAKYSTQYPFCNQCGTNRQKYLQWQRKEQKRKENIKEEDRREYLMEEARKIKNIIREKVETRMARIGLLFVILFSYWIVKCFMPWIMDLYPAENLTNILFTTVIASSSCVIIVYIFKKIFNKLNEFLYHRKLERWKDDHSDDEISQYLY